MPRGRGLAAVAAAALLVGMSGCQLKDDGDNLVAGKQDFVAKCGSCHILKRAGTTGVTGPNLDEAFQQARSDRLRPEHVQGHRLPPDPPARPAAAQIDPRPASRPRRCRPSCSRAKDAQDVAAYVASAVVEAGRGQGPARDRRRQALQRGRQGGGRQARRSPPTRRAASPTRSARPRRPPAGRDRLGEQVVDRPQHRGRGQRRQREGRGRQERRRLEGHRRPQARRVHVLLLRPGPPPGRHGGQAHRQVTAGAAAPPRAPRRRRTAGPRG